MSRAMDMQVEHRNSNLFIKLCGEFNPGSARIVTNTILQRYNGTGNVFVNVEKVGTVQSSGRKTFRKLLDSSSLPKDKIYFIGKKGLEIGMDGLRVIVRKKVKCSGNCRGCSKPATRPRNPPMACQGINDPARPNHHNCC